MAAKTTRHPKTPLARTAKTTSAAKTPKAVAAQTNPSAATSAEPKPKKVSALEAAAQLLAQTGQALTCAQMIQALATSGTWTSPQGKTPEATLYAAIIREIQSKGAHARFRKTDRGTFAHP
jgi:HB1, ASXL, restriction endonuclease HTH domain